MNLTVKDLERMGFDNLTKEASEFVLPERNETEDNPISIEEERRIKRLLSNL